MKVKAHHIVTYGIRRDCLIRHWKPMVLSLLVVAVFAAWAVPRAYSQPDEPYTVTADVPFEMLAPWYNPDRTEVIDEVLLRGTLRVTTRTWASSATDIDRFALHANAVNIRGTSETTGQRFRLNGSFSFDLRDPEVTFNADGTFNVPLQPWELRLHFVDPEPARLSQYLGGGTGATGASVYVAPPPPQQCQRILAPDGTPTISINCGNVIFSYVQVHTPYFYRVFSSGGTACIPGQACVVPDGATLFNGYTGGYNPPLFLRTTVNMSSHEGAPVGRSVRVFCKTGERAPLISGTIFAGGAFIGSCRPGYSATDPIKVWAEVTYRYYRYISSSQPSQEVTLIVNEKPFTFRMDERLVDHPPVIDPTSFSVKAASGPSGGLLARCVVLLPCDVFDGDILFNGQTGDFYPPLSMRLNASDGDGDQLTVQWYCKTGTLAAPITDLFGGVYSCTPFYSSTEPITVFAVVSDGQHQVTSEIRTLRMLERVN